MPEYDNKGNYRMNKAQRKKFDSLYNEHISALQRQGKAENTIDAYSRAVRRITEFFDRCPDRLDQSDLKAYFTALVKSHSWSTVKIDRNGLQFFYKHVTNDQQKLLQPARPYPRSYQPNLSHQACRYPVNSFTGGSLS